MSGVMTTAEDGKELPISLPFGVCCPAILVAVCVVTVSVVVVILPSASVVEVVIYCVIASLVGTVSIIVIGPPLETCPKIVPGSIPS